MSSYLSPADTSKERFKSQVKDNQENGDSCGICYAGHGEFVAGEIDCCNHYFCFFCIMEWAKHESRCPLCRQRFFKIRRPPKLGLFSSARYVRVPCRNQGDYHPIGNVRSDPDGSHAEVKSCSICHLKTFENLMLLCNLCGDIASHTFCTGLGYTVPEGDWFCHDCDTSRLSVPSTNEESEQGNEASVVTISDIVRGTRRINQVDRRPNASSSSSSSPPSQQDQSSLPPVVPMPDRVSGQIPVSRAALAKHRIQVLRDNWNALRVGSLRFQSNSDQSGSTRSENQDSSSLSRVQLDVSPSTASGSGGRQQSAVQVGGSSNVQNDRDLYGVDKAWKMMEMAKMKQRTSSIPQGVDNPSSTRVREMSSTPFDCPKLENQQLRKLDSRHTRMEKKCDHSSLNKNFENHSHRYPKLGEKRKSSVDSVVSSRLETLQHVKESTNPEGSCERQLPSMVHTGIQGARRHDYKEKNIANEQRRLTVASEGSLPEYPKLGEKRKSVVSSRDETIQYVKYSTNSDEYCERPLPKMVHIGIQGARRHDYEERNVANEQRRFAVASEGSSAPSHCKFGSVNSDKDVDICNEEKRLAKSSADGNTGKIEDAKTEIQSIVKTNLKLLTKDNKLGVDAFKAVARKATHTILAACSSNQQSSNIHSSSSICSHHGQQFQTSTLMPNCCRQCFDVFVNHTVNSILLEKVGRA